MTTHNQNPSFLRTRPAQSGFTLVEIMVGLVIGMLATMVVMQVFSVFESQKRTTTGASDALTSGNISLYKLQQDIQSAGYPLTPLDTAFSPLNCNALAIDPALTNPAATGIVTGITPVVIGDGISDSITIRYGTSELGGVPNGIVGMAGNILTMNNTLGCVQNDYALVMSGNICGMSTVTNVVPSTGLATGTVTLNNPTNAVLNGTISCLGTLWHEITYQVDPAGTNTLQRRDTADNPAFRDSVADIVNIQAQYGISLATNDKQVAQWVDPTGAWAPLAITINDRKRIKAVHIAVVARNAKRDVANVSFPCTSNKGTINQGPCAWDDTNFDPSPRIDLSADPDWQHYRYRVFDIIIPLRNVLVAAPTLIP